MFSSALNRNICMQQESFPPPNQAYSHIPLVQALNEYMKKWGSRSQPYFIAEISELMIVNYCSCKGCRQKEELVKPGKLPIWVGREWLYEDQDF